jgi:hypothetical protein
LSVSSEEELLLRKMMLEIARKRASRARDLEQDEPLLGELAQHAPPGLLRVENALRVDARALGKAGEGVPIRR